MYVCILTYLVIAVLFVRYKQWPKRVFLILLLTNSLALGAFYLEQKETGENLIVERNDYGKGSRLETYDVVVGENEATETFEIEVEEREYSADEAKKILTEAMRKLDEIVLGENKSFDRVEQDLQLVSTLETYPVTISWQLDHYTVMDMEGKIRSDRVVEEGTLVELRGILSCQKEQAIYVRSAMVYPPAREGAELLMYEIEQALQIQEKNTREEESFVLPAEVAGQKLQWNAADQKKGYLILVLGGVLAAFIIYDEKEQERKRRKRREEELIRDYPGVITKLTMLLSTGMTIRNAWEKIVKNYELQKEVLGVRTVYEEMNLSLREMQGGIPEGEVYERFGKRCGLTMYMKFGAMLSQNLRKGSKGLSDLLRVEGLQSFENRKSLAKKQGEEASAKLLLPMIGMLGVVLVMVIVPAFMTMQI